MIIYIWLIKLVYDIVDLLFTNIISLGCLISARSSNNSATPIPSWVSKYAMDLSEAKSEVSLMLICSAIMKKLNASCFSYRLTWSTSFHTNQSKKYLVAKEGC